MFCIALEISGCTQLEKTENEFISELWKAIDAAAGLRGGRRTRLDDNYFVLAFDAQDAGDAHRVLEAACAVRETLDNAQNTLVGYLLLAEFFPSGTHREAAARELRDITSLCEIDDSLLLGPAGAELFLPYCEADKAGDCLRVKSRLPQEGPRLGSAAEFCLRRTAAEALAARLGVYLECAQPPKVFLVYGPAFSGIRYQLEAALETLKVFSVCRLYPLPGQLLPALEFPGFDQVPQVLCAAERKLWQEKKNVFDWKKSMDFPFEEAFSAYSLAVSSYMRLCERELAPAVLVCEELHAMSDTAKKFLALIFRRNLPLWKLLPVCLSREEKLGEEFAGIPVEKYELPAIDSEEIRRLIEALSGKKSVSSLIGVRKSSGGILALYFEFLAQGAQAEAEEEAFREFRSVMRFLRTQERPLREILYILQEASGLIPAPRLEEFLLTLDFAPAQCSDIIRRLAGMGLIRDTKSLLPVFPELRRFLRKDPTLRKTKITEELAGFLYRLWKEKTCGGETILMDFFAENRKTSWLTEVFQEYTDALLDAGNTQEARRLLAKKFPVPLSPEMKLAAAACRLRLALALNDEEGAAEAFSRMDPPRQEGPYYGESLIQKTPYWLKKGDQKEALGCAKNAVMLFQGIPREGSMGRAHTAVGLAMLAAGNPEQAIDYFLMARESEGGSARTIFFEGICRFIMGNYTQALGSFGQAAELADSRYARRWSMAARFMEGRILFELGEYEAAAGVFERLLGAAASLRYSAPVPVVYTWLARSLLYQADTRMAVRILDKCGKGPEAGFFRAEADYFRKEYRKARDRLEPLLNSSYPGEFFLGDAPTWKDGFYFAENICIGRPGGSFLLPNLIRFFHAYLCALGTESSSGIEMMSRLLRDEKTSRNDPFLRLYYYWYFRVLPQRQTPALEDRLTILSRAVQNLQSRTSKMDSPGHKRAFTGKNAWNRLLMEDARQNNLM